MYVYKYMFGWQILWTSLGADCVCVQFLRQDLLLAVELADEAQLGGCPGNFGELPVPTTSVLELQV